jgi:membrane protein implicated in regulation of membrane protease activity
MPLDFDAYWFWLILAVILGTAELLLPGVFLIWVAMAAAITGLITFAADPPFAAQLAIFAVTAVAATLGGRRWYSANPIPSADPLLNDRAARLVGETVELTRAIVNGHGRARVGDSDWIASGPDLAVGERVRITGNDGATLLVEPIALLPEKDS